MGAVVDWRGATRTWCRNKPNVSTTWVHSTETSVRHSKSSAMWPGQMCLISLPMGPDRITCLPLRRELPDHKVHCWRVPTHCIPWRHATSTRSGSRRSGMVIKTVHETVRVFQTNNNNRPFARSHLSACHSETSRVVVLGRLLVSRTPTPWCVVRANLWHVQTMLEISCFSQKVHNHIA